MTQDDKNLLLQDLCGRLPYGVIVHFEGWNPEKLTQIDLRELVFNDMGGIPKPCLRPMSSMTDEEEDEYEIIIRSSLTTHIDWLNKNMFDYRGLIKRGGWPLKPQKECIIKIKKIWTAKI